MVVEQSEEWSGFKYVRVARHGFTSFPKIP